MNKTHPNNSQIYTVNNSFEDQPLNLNTTKTQSNFKYQTQTQTSNSYHKLNLKFEHKRKPNQKISKTKPNYKP